MFTRFSVYVRKFSNYSFLCVCAVIMDGLFSDEELFFLHKIVLMQKEVDRPTRLLQFVAFVHLPFSFRSLDLFVASLLFRQGTSFCIIRRK